MPSSLILLAALAGVPALSEYPKARRAGDVLTVQAGKSVKVRLRVPLTGPPTKYAQVLVRSSGWTGIAETSAMGEVVKMNKTPSSVEVVLLLSANAPTRRAVPGAIRVVINDPNIGRNIGEFRWRPQLQVEANRSPVDVAALDKQLAQAREALNITISGTGPLAKMLRARGMVMLRPDNAQWRNSLDPVIRAQGSIQALTAQLRAFGLTSDSAAAKAAVVAIAKHRGPALRPSDRALDRLGPEKGLSRASALVSRLQFELALGWIEALLNGDRLQRAGIAKAMALQGTILGLGGYDNDARTSFGKASCLDPVARPPDRAIFRQVYDRLAKPPACAQPLTAGTVTAERRVERNATVITVSIAFGPDPFNLVNGGSVRLFNPQGDLMAEQAGTPERDDEQPVLMAEFVDDGTLADPLGQIMVSGSLSGPGGASIADVGVPDPVAVAVDNAAPVEIGGTAVPWWVWVTLGAVVVGGATAAAVVVATSDDEGTDRPRGIGPVDIQF